MFKVLTSALLGLLLITSTQLNAAPVYLSEFRGGVGGKTAQALPDFFKVVAQCYASAPCDASSNQPAQFKQCQAAAKTCLLNYLQTQKANEQALAFARYQTIPSQIAALKRYGALTVVRAQMAWADASSGLFIITKEGLIIPTFDKLEFNRDARFIALQQRYPAARLQPGPEHLAWPALQTNPAGLTQLVFDYPVKDNCRACATIARADVAYNFRGQAFIGTELLKLTVTKN